MRETSIGLGVIQVAFTLFFVALVVWLALGVGVGALIVWAIFHLSITLAEDGTVPRAHFLPPLRPVASHRPARTRRLTWKSSASFSRDSSSGRCNIRDGVQLRAQRGNPQAERAAWQFIFRGDA